MAEKAGSATRKILQKAIALQDGLIAYATGQQFEDTEYQDLRRDLLANVELKEKLPQFVRETRDLAKFWPLIKEQSGNYAGRRKFIWDLPAPWLPFWLQPGKNELSKYLKNFAPKRYPREALVNPPEP